MASNYEASWGWPASTGDKGVHPLRDLLTNGSDSPGRPRDFQAVSSLTEVPTNAAALHVFEPDKPTALKINVSTHAIGALLGQKATRWPPN